MAQRSGGGGGEPAFQPWASLAVGEYRRLWTAVVLANSGRWAFVVGIGWLVHTLTHSPLWVGASVFAIQGPVVVVAPLAGVLADRFDRGRLLALGLAAAAAVCLGLWLASEGRVASLPVILAGCLAFGIAFTLQSNSWNALVPPIVPRPLLANAVALVTMARQGSEFTGPLLATPLLVASGPGAVLEFCVLLYAAAAVMAARLPARPMAAGPTQRVGRSLMDGLRYLEGNAPVRAMVPFIGLHCVCTMAYLGLLPRFVQVAFGAGSQGYGDVMTAVGVGALAGALAVAALPRAEVSRGPFALSVVVSGLSLSAFALSRSLGAGLVMAAAMGASQSFFMAWSAAFVQWHVDDRFRGRVSSLRSVVTQGTMSVGNWSWGALGVLLPAGWILGTLGTVFVVAAWLWARRSDVLGGLLRVRPAAATTAL
jgi:MFS family permease